MLTIEKLKAYGANVDEGLSRCMNNETFYLRLVNMAADDAGFERLRTALEKNDRKAGFGTDGDAADGDRVRNRQPGAYGGNTDSERETVAAER